jgi:hypothetical protein
MKKKVRIQRPMRTLHLDTRVTQKESDIIKRKAEECGLTVSDYMRRCALGHSPKMHLTDKEIEAYCSLTEMRQHFTGITNALRGKSDEEKQEIFGDVAFMRKWVRAVRNVLVYWDNLIKKMKE